MSGLVCRNCGSALHHTFADLGESPLANSFLRPGDLSSPEPRFPLHARVCAQCFLVQLPEIQRPENIFSDYAYFSSFSESWLRHARDFADFAIRRFALRPASLVVEVACNDGYLLQYFRERSIPVLGIEPAANVAQAALDKGIPTLIRFFGLATASELQASGRPADLLVANNVLAHVPDLADFVAGLHRALKPHGTIVLEFPHLLRLIEDNQFDTIYHEHFSYFSFLAAQDVLARYGLSVFDVEEVPTHGGSLRLFARHSAANSAPPHARVADLCARERAAGLRDLRTYESFGQKVCEVKHALLAFLRQACDAGKSVAGYGAPAKGNTLLNFCGVGPDLLPYTVDVSPHKQGLFLPGSHIPIYHPGKIRETRPHYVLILPWNLREEIVQKNSYIREWGGRFVIPIPVTQVLE